MSEAQIRISRAVPNIKCGKMEDSKKFYEDFLGLEVRMDLGWIVTLVSPTNTTTEISLLKEDPSGMHPQVSIGVDNVDVAYKKAIDMKLKIVRPITDEPWGVRRFFVVDPNGAIVNVISHRRQK
jgi:predicted enzyme related to lactoylglutathione lyase